MEKNGLVKLFALGIMAAMIFTGIMPTASRCVLGELPEGIDTSNYQHDNNSMVISKVRIPNRVIKAGETSSIQFTLKNQGIDDATQIKVDVYQIQDENETFLITLQHGRLKPVHERTFTVDWTPPAVGYYYLKLIIIYIERDENFWFEHQSGFYAIRTGVPEMRIQGDWVISTPTVYENMTIIIDGNVFVTAPLTLKDTNVVADNWDVSNVMTVELLTGSASLNMGCEEDGQFRMWISDTGILQVLNNEIIYNNPSDYTYGFIVDGQLIVDGGIVKNVGTNKNAVGTHAPYSGTGIRIYNKDPAKMSEFTNYATIENCEGNGIYLAPSSNALIDGNSVIRDNDEYGIFIDGAASSTINSCEIYNNMQAGVYCKGAVSTISNNDIYNNGLGLKSNEGGESDQSGWQATGLWHRVYSGDVKVSTSNISHRGEWSWLCGADPSEGNRATQDWGNLISPEIDLRDARTASLSFWSYYVPDNTTATPTDMRSIIVSSPSRGTSTTITLESVPGEEFQGGWKLEQFDISKFAGTAIKLDFNFVTDRGDETGFYGWYMDDIMVHEGNSGYDGVCCEGDKGSTLSSNVIYSNEGDGIYLREADGTIINGNTFISNNQGYGIDLSRSTNVEVNGAEIYNHASNCGIYMTDYSLNNLVQDCEIYDNSLYGILAQTYARDNDMIGNTIFNTGTSQSIGIKLDDHSDGNEISGNTISNFLCGAQFCSYCSNNLVSGNTFSLTEEGLSDGLSLYRSSGNEITGNTITPSAVNNYGMHLNHLSMGNVIQGNIISQQTSGIFCEDGSSDNLIELNTLSENKYGVKLLASLNNNISNNDVTDNTLYGIWCIDSSGMIAGNNIEYNAESGIQCNQSTMQILDNPSISYNLDGIYIIDTTYAEVAGNTITNNINAGIKVTSSTPVIHDNEEISSNMYGIYVENSQGGQQNAHKFGYEGEDEDTVAFYEYGDTLGHEFTRYTDDHIEMPFYDISESSEQQTGVCHPDVLYFKDGLDGYKYWMYYNSAFRESAEVTALVRSNDGFNFTDAGVKNPIRPDGAIFDGTTDHHTADQDVINISETEWLMYYCQQHGDDTEVHHLDLATSSNGIDWTRWGQAQLDGNPIYGGDPTVIYKNGQYMMWWNHHEVPPFYATSSDGKNWVEQTYSWKGGDSYNDHSHPEVTFDGTIYKMYYQNYNDKKLHIAISKDPSDCWVGYATVLSPLADSWEANGIAYRASPVIVDGTMMFYYAINIPPAPNHPAIGLATDSFPTVILPKSAKIISAKMELTGLENTVGEVTSFPHDVKIDIGSDGIFEWENPGEFSSTDFTLDDSNTAPTISSAMQAYLDKAETNNGTVQVPFVISSTSIGKVKFSGLNIDWEYATNISKNTIKNNEYGTYINSSPTYIAENTLGTSINYVENETVGSKWTPEGKVFELANDNVLNCTLYALKTIFGFTIWEKLEEWTDYRLDYDTGEIELLVPIPPLEKWTLYAFYNYTIPGGNGYGIYSVRSDSILANNTIVGNVEDGIHIENQLDYTIKPAIDNNTVLGNRQGVVVFNGTATIKSNNIKLSKGSGVLLDNSKGEIFLNTITDNHKPRSIIPPEQQLTGIEVQNSDGIWIHHNNVYYNTANIYLVHSINVNVEWNTIIDWTRVLYLNGPAAKGIYSVSSQMTASNNVFWGTCIGMDISDADSGTIIGYNEFNPFTSFPSDPAIGIRLDNAPVQVEWNAFDGIDCGIYCTYSSPLIQNNEFNNCWWGIKSYYDAPSNSGANGALLVGDNTFSNNIDGDVIQYWWLQIYVEENSQGVPYEPVTIWELGGGTAYWSGYTGSDGYTDKIDVVEYYWDGNGLQQHIKTPHLVLVRTELHTNVEMTQNWVENFYF